MTPPPATPHQPRREQETCWHHVRNFLTNRGSLAPQAPVPFVVCPVCYCELDIAGIPARNPDSPTANLRVPGVVLVCGHMTCEPCWEWISGGYEKNRADARMVLGWKAGLNQTSNGEEREQQQQQQQQQEEEQSVVRMAVVEEVVEDHLGEQQQEDQTVVVVVMADDEEYQEVVMQDEEPQSTMCILRCSIRFSACGCLIPPFAIPSSSSSCDQVTDCHKNIPKTVPECRSLNSDDIPDSCQICEKTNTARLARHWLYQQPIINRMTLDSFLEKCGTISKDLEMQPTSVVHQINDLWVTDRTTSNDPEQHHDDGTEWTEQELYWYCVTVGLERHVTRNTCKMNSSDGMGAGRAKMEYGNAGVEDKKTRSSAIPKKWAVVSITGFTERFSDIGF
ncbi:hypothetical protein QBC38DRAFT_504788 [Podospora fimiseda]|uniref:Uncharacterized protein n=1 Tax=Podospora fimiseda TaxID=252190 RepID=A0AAN6YM07_9PEZI|nr:hypothetical protein QBC38DRAFT_504788 [Podospora fimiseda]